jgi:phage gp46-like protein
MSTQIKVDPETKDYVVSAGRPVETRSLTARARIRLTARRGRWQYAPDDRWGSEFHLIKRRNTTQNPSALENTGTRALQALIDDGTAAEVTVTTQVATRTGVGVKVNIVDAQGEPQILDLPRIGV